MRPDVGRSEVRSKFLAEDESSLSLLLQNLLGLGFLLGYLAAVAASTSFSP